MNPASIFRSALTIISPRLNAQVCHRIKTGKRLDFRNPKTFAEKLVVLKIRDYNRSPLVRRCADKYAVREWIEEQGCGRLLNDLLATYDAPEQIRWDELPDQFALKWNFGCGYNIICKNKSELDVADAVRQLKKWRKERPWLGYAEMQYKGVTKKIIVEKFLATKSGALPPDYKLYCFNGRCAAILYVADRDKDEHKAAFFSPEWRYLGLPQKESGKKAYAEFDERPPAPASLPVMLETAKILGAPFPFVRIDYYDVDGRAVFGEMTFTPAGGHDVSVIDVDGVKMTDFLRI